MYPNEKQMNAMSQKAELPKDSAARKIRHQLISLVNRSNALAERAENVLAPVSQSSILCAIGSGGADCCEWMPPLFDEYRSSADNIENAIRRIEVALDRLEI